MPYAADALAGSTVLLVEDDWFIAGYVASVVEAAGAEVLGPFSGSCEALTSSFDRPSTVHAALLSVPLKTGEGLMIADALTRAAVPIIFSTGCRSLSLPPRFAHCQILIKPFAAYQVVKALMQLLPQSATQQV